VAVELAVPKLSPLIVTLPPPLGAAFAEVILTTGAAETTGWHEPSESGHRRGAPSKLNRPASVPATALTLTAVRPTAEPPYACGAHATVVADVHALLPHAPVAVSEAVAVELAVPKLSPLIVTLPPALGTVFGGVL
jgi:hypothetical protein